MNNEELSVIKQAIINEIEGYEFYKMAANQSSSPEVKSSYLELAKEEENHIEWLNDLFEKITTSDKDNTNLALLDKVPSPNIFSFSNLDRKDAAIAVSVFGIGIQMERASVEFYTNAASKCTSKGAKDIFNTLVKWEKSHLDQFSAQYEKLKEGWWNDQGYAPF
ncbi:ferritin family protein [Clostridium algidicarnis]|uniref:ferritin family protein n=1 Tax=Clostridium algidicarnis TaxID=37659 RepID=UPI000495B983|nr:ferritin family protein [Clostridium algidicarnis]MBU3193345.1 ferritin family protein [Clostridium algidicarnis]MBU3204695.1 ferritin family protein [Clostridium algidicarnis]MBU3206672.1 ferritin family protein [Clostridium algidicarnis]MBU3212820.1 ferritin family protein [Clostridium algidicarnis]MBU3223464.1 ferritin family protein [Clostridium algidicarnis]